MHRFGSPLSPHISGIATTRRRGPLVSLGLASLLLLSGCTSVKVKLGWKVYLDKTPIASIEVSQAKGTGIAPGEYKLFAWELLAPYSYFDPDVLREYETKGTPIVISEASREAVELRVIPTN